MHGVGNGQAADALPAVRHQGLAPENMGGEGVEHGGMLNAFRDIAPQAPTHILIVSKAHTANLSQAAALPDEALAGMLRAIGKIAAQEKLENGYRVVTNCGPDACQSVQHLHFHLLGGRKMADSMA